MKKFTKYIITALLCASIMLGMIIPSAMPVKAAVISGKTGIGMAEWALRAYREGWEYKYGGSSAGAVDCSGLIRSYCNGKGGGAKALLDAASVKGDMDSIPRVHGLGLWLSGHAGVYVGKDENGVDMAVDSRNAKKDMQYDELYGNTWPVWVKWYKIDMISYPTQGWYEFDGNMFYYDNGEFVVGEFTVDGVTYDFGKSGACKGIVSSIGANITTVTVTHNKKYIRSGAGTSNDVVGYSKAGTYLCLGKETVSDLTWYKIAYSDNSIGWLSGNYVEENQQGGNVSFTTVTVTNNGKYIRSGAGTSNDVIGYSKKGDYICLGTKEVSGIKWHNIIFSDNQIGWLSGNYVKPYTNESTVGTSTVTVTHDGIYIRSGAGTSNAVIGNSVKGNYTCLGTKTLSGLTWYNIVISENKTGWISGNYVKPYEEKIIGKLRITGSTVNVRQGIGTGYAKITAVSENERFDFTETGKDSSGTTWYRIKISSTVSGWISGSYVEVTEGEGSTTATTTTTTNSTTTTTTAAQKKVQITGEVVNVRSGAGTGYGVVTTVREGETYVYTDTKTVSDKIWYKITVGTKTGWVIGTYAKVISSGTTTATPTTTAKPTTTTTTTAAQKKVQITGEVVNVRSGAGTSYGVVTTVKKGSTYVYTDTKTVSGKIWYKITVGTKTGWVIGTYAKTV